MKEEADPARSDKRGKSAGEELESLNAEVRDQGAQVTRKHIEADIEKKARRRRATEKPASSGFKTSGS